MNDIIRSNSAVVSRYLDMTPKSAELAKQARRILPSGIAHDVRYLRPHNIYTERAEGIHKWDVDGNHYIDYFGGHGALMFGNNDPEIRAFIEETLAKGTHFGNNHPLEVEWASLVQQLIPCAERVRFTSSGTEATHLAIRLARAFTGKSNIIRFRTNFHGWHDHMASGYVSHFDGSAPSGVLAEIAAHSLLLDPNDAEGAERLLGERDDIAAVILEPTGASYGLIPMADGVLERLRKACAEAGVLLIFDEVITGFRVSPGGAQAEYGITPDLTTLGKIIAGGLPGAAVAGRKDVLDLLDFDAAAAKGAEKITHYGTFNGNPVCAAAGVAMLKRIADGTACERANQAAAELRRRINESFARNGIPWACYGTYSAFHIFTNTENRDIDPHEFDPLSIPFKELKNNPADLVEKFRLALMINGVDITGWPGGMTSAVHSDDDLEKTERAFDEALQMLLHEGEFG